MYKAKQIAEYIVWRLNKGDLGYSTISNLKLQKVLYFLQAEFLVSTGSPLFSDKIIAWDFGPVVEDVYQEYKIFGGAFIPGQFKKHSPLIAKDDADRIDVMLKELDQYSNTYLTDLVHHQKPWRNNYIRGCNMVIPNSDIKAYFTED